MKWLKNIIVRSYRKLFPVKVKHGSAASTDRPDRIIRKVALVVGHELDAPGAIDVNGLYERYYWAQVCSTMDRYDCNKELQVIFRDGIGISGAMKQAEKFGADVILELHFNSYNRKAGGCEALYTEPSYWLAKEFCDYISTSMGRKNRGPKNIKDMSRGKYNVTQAQKVAKYAILCEPFFGDNEKDYINIDPMARAMVSFVNKL